LVLAVAASVWSTKLGSSGSDVCKTVAKERERNGRIVRVGHIYTPAENRAMIGVVRFVGTGKVQPTILDVTFGY
jgi:hypothetical protein